MKNVILVMKGHCDPIYLKCVCNPSIKTNLPGKVTKSASLKNYKSAAMCPISGQEMTAMQVLDVITGLQ